MTQGGHHERCLPFMYVHVQSQHSHGSSGSAAHLAKYSCTPQMEKLAFICRSNLLFSNFVALLHTFNSSNAP
jgi:hypothetical protein